MAKYGTITKYFGTNNYDNLAYTATAANAIYSLVLNWEVVGTDIMNGTSTISWNVKATLISFDSVNSGNFDFNDNPSYLRFGTDDTGIPDVLVKIGSTKVYSIDNLVVDLYEGDTKQLASGTFTVTHDSTGAFSDTLSCTVRPRNIYDTEGNPACTPYGDIDLGSRNAATVSGIMTLDNVPKYAVIQSAPDFTDEDSPTITFAIPEGVTNVRAYISFSTSTIDIGSYAVSGSSYTFRFTDKEKAKLWSILDEGLDTKQVYFYVMSTFNGTLYYSSLIRTLTVVNYRPTIDPVVYDTNSESIALTGNKYNLIRYVSNAYWETGAQGNKGATIRNQLVKNGATTVYGASGTIEGVSNNLFTFTAVDSYGRSVTADMQFSEALGNWIPYVKLTCSTTATEMTADGDVQITITGKYFSGDFGAKTNQMRMHYDISKNNEDFEHVDMGYIYPTVDSESNYTYTFTITGLEYLNVYELTVRVSDEVSVEGSESHVVLAATPIFDWGRTDFNFNVPVTIQGGSVPTIIDQGTTFDNWTYRKWSDGIYECWRNLDISVNISGAWGGLFTSGNIAATNLRFPITFVEIPVVTVTLAAGYAGGIIMTTGASAVPVSTSQTGTFEIARGTAYSSANYKIAYNVKGRWK